MKWIVAVFLLVLAVDARAETPEERYLAARDADIAKFTSSSDAQALEQEQAALKDLAGLLRPIVGPVKMKGFPAEAELNLSTLSKGDSGFGQLDGLVFVARDERTRVVVTTPALLQHWMGEHREDGVPQTIASALESSELYWWALTDAAFAKYAELPVAKPGGASLAVGVVGVRGNGTLKGTPNEINVAMVQGDRVFIATAPIRTKVATIPACEKVWKTAMAKPSGKTKPDDAARREDEADAAFARCFGTGLRSKPAFAALAKEAQALLDLLPTP